MSVLREEFDLKKYQIPRKKLVIAQVEYLFMPQRSYASQG